MIKKFFIILLSILFLVVTLSAADTKKTAVKKEESKKEETKVVKRTPPEPKNAAFKEKIGIGIDVVNRNAQLRIWASNKLAFDVIAGLNFVGGDNSSFGLNLGGNIVFPMLDDQKLRIDLAPGMLLTYGRNSVSAGGVSFTESNLQFLFNVGLSLEVFLGPVCNDLSIGSSIGAGFGFKNTSVESNSTTNFVFSIANDFTVYPVIIRYYL